MGEAIAFYTLAALILAFAILVITARSTVHSVLFLVANFLCIAALYVTLSAPFVAVIQIITYAGGIVVLYLFVVMLVNLKRPPEVHRDPHRRSRVAFVLACVLLAEMAAIAVWGYVRPAASMPVAHAGAAQNVEQVGMLLYTNYLVPFEVASMMLLVAMVGAIILARREL